jgi:hypothetical protein
MSMELFPIYTIPLNGLKEMVEKGELPLSVDYVQLKFFTLDQKKKKKKKIKKSSNPTYIS